MPQNESWARRRGRPRGASSTCPGDGVNNSGPSAEEARDRAVAEGVTINGLPILNDHPGFGFLPAVPLDENYRESVVGGPGALVIAVEEFGSFVGRMAAPHPVRGRAPARSPITMPGLRPPTRRPPRVLAAVYPFSMGGGGHG